MQSELEFEPQEFPVSVQGHTLQDTTRTMVMGVGLYCLKPEAKAFPAIPLLQKDGVDVRVASNGRYIYFWGKNRLAAVSLDEIFKGARFHLTGKSEKEPLEAPAAEKAPFAVKRRACCSVCKETDIDLFTGTDTDAVGENGWIVSGGAATCPDCLEKQKT